MRDRNSRNDPLSLPGIYRQQKGKGSLRLLRVGEEIRRILSEIFERGDIKNADLSNYLITITEVSVSPDLGHADVFVTSLKSDETTMPLILKGLKDKAPFLRHMLSKRVTFKRLPHLHFKEDTRFLHMEKIERILYSDKVKEDLEKE
ncbi:MAG: ribosome-binding factor A [Alphaproteobacteria bacterium 16-39-46]|nr:MAG: ribosome-binding factor A [Alphaproteobacteria bacterium 16-39-46]OZA43439.1 MAG: ribosome-binding factor A [Alphaproteobacteria bacterium 17-39-52]HQS83851.1 30S ribosome-binding factor RbfA [Alphaproteobacteria bacterium]HQS93734.1 30S ribosome-binding factor RbfA [Alphaproteobacteria bacterium]